ncbi:MAG TPA: SIMPL domain-containing protein [Albidovulum sp.]|uniref:SIMPL domain-containing protein n=1 Tax=Albidovulum sp. TaxID=1872424 RepID=UPI002C457B0F|nr:SIMPL domain-containing protein [Albidovulum sp.]
MRLFPIAATALMLALPAYAETQPATISVTGEGRVEIAPDMATVNLGVTTEADTAAAALKANSEALAAALAKLKEAGIADRDIQTSGLSVNPRYDYPNDGSQPKLNGYVAANMVMVRVRDLSVLGTMLDGAVSDGANTLNGIAFSLQETDATMDEARRRAVTDATHKAALYAEAAGVKLGRIASITEQMNYGGPQPMMMAEARMAKDAGSVPVASGELTVASTVSVVFEIAQ